MRPVAVTTAATYFVMILFCVLHVLENNGSLWATVRVVAYPIHEFS